MIDYGSGKSGILYHKRLVKSLIFSNFANHDKRKII